MGDVIARCMRARANAADTLADGSGKVGHGADDGRIAHQRRQAARGIARGNRKHVAAGCEMFGIVGEDIVDQLRLDRRDDEIEALPGDIAAVGNQRDPIGHIAARGIDHGYRFGTLDPLRK